MIRPAPSLALVVLAVVATPAAGAQPPAAGPPLTLEEAVARAAAQAPAAQAARASVRAARWRDRAFDARRRPQLELTATTPNLNRAIIPVVQPDGKTVYRAQRQTESSFALRASQPIPLTGGSVFVQSGLSRLDVFGEHGTSRLYTSSPLVIGFRQDVLRVNRLAWDGREQDLVADAAERRYLEAREDVAVATAAAFLDVYAARVAEENAATNVAVNDSLFTISTRRYDVGTIGENDLLQSELALLRARAALDQARLSRERARATLAVALGTTPDRLPEIAPPTDVPRFTADPERAVAEAVRNRALGLDLELQDVQADRRVREAQLNSRLGATVTAQAGLNQSAPELDAAYGTLRDQQRVTVSVQMPLVQWRAGKADVEAARAERERVEHGARAQRATLEQDARFAALEVDQARRQLDLARLADSVAARRFESAKSRYLIGRIGIDNLFIAQGEKDQARLALAQALRGYWIAHHRLRRLTLYDFVAGRPIEE